MRKKIIHVSKAGVRVISAHTSGAAETRAFRTAVEKAIRTNQANGHPIARYDALKRRPYLEYPDGRREYAK